ncbi:MAG: hypothetical protein IJK29_01010 [Bacteroidales bacterium]|nr:hypothetical protein [Bacteroidales bacterium]
MGSHRRNWGWWLVAAIAVAVAASLFLHRKPADSETSAPAASSSPAVEADSPETVVRDTVYVKVDGESVPVVRERTVETGEPDEDAPATAAVTEMVVSVPVKELNSLVRGKSGRDITVSTEAPDKITVSYAGNVDIPVLGEQGMNFSADFKVVEVTGEHLVLQLDSGAAMNLAADAVAPYVLKRLPAGLVDSFSNGRAVINLSAIPQLKKRLNSMDIVGFSIDENEIRLRTVEK